MNFLLLIGVEQVLAFIIWDQNGNFDITKTLAWLNRNGYSLILAK